MRMLFFLEAGRIGSGRFDRGERDERPRGGTLGLKGTDVSRVIHVPIGIGASFSDVNHHLSFIFIFCVIMIRMFVYAIFLSHCMMTTVCI